MHHADTISTIADHLDKDARVRALFLSGSHGNGMADAFSDIDFVLVTGDGATDEIAELWRAAVARTGDIVLWWDRLTVPVLINAITADWTRTDVIILKPDQLSGHTKAGLKPVIDHDTIYNTLKDAPPAPAPNTRKLAWQFEEFIRILGLLHLVDGRGEYLNGVLGVYHLRNLLVDLMIEETAAPGRGGALHLNRLITDEQKAALSALPTPEPTRDAIIAAHMAYARSYLPGARALAERLGLNWPEAFEAATWAKLQDSMKLRRPY
ncbi:nucleotidyltransferase domain-containing protein [uncultured Roseobacter sp.]|uniref:nucleotidyltransferase domain-containing protein n=1 Tax=uncultured Roseobacter sp. TaxID=114847 RepID=UPI002617C0E6|nr:nucleotidyltransferase domain-containing protein [uncultured Roseobacter sp.]